MLYNSVQSGIVFLKEISAQGTRKYNAVLAGRSTSSLLSLNRTPRMHMRCPEQRNFLAESGTQYSKFLAVLLLFALALTAGCAPLEQRRQDFIDRRNAEIGNKFAQANLPAPVKITPLENGKTYYLFEDKESGCRWSIEVDEQSKTIDFWIYEGNPNLCYD